MSDFGNRRSSKGMSDGSKGPKGEGKYQSIKFNNMIFCPTRFAPTALKVLKLANDQYFGHIHSGFTIIKV